MDQRQVGISENFKKMTIKAISSIAFFLLVYLVLFALAILLTIGCGYAGIFIFTAKPHWATGMLALGMISMGLLVIFFLVKFLFKKHTIDRSHLIEITKKQEPQIFQFIDELVKEVDTHFPKKIYISGEVNASVFYDSSFWSMFLPIKKNLQIGLGLVNSVSKNELKAILAHEFGHFSQRSMKVGSYVYNVNQVIYNMLYDNDSFGTAAEKLASVNNYFAIFVGLSIKIVLGIQTILRKVYEVVNLNYMALSREMEFHADEVAANVVGPQPLITSLLRLGLADQSYNSVINFYDKKIPEAIKTQNIYPQHRFLLNFLADDANLPIGESNLPLVNVEFLSRYNKSKLNIEDQWASHPSTEDRIERLNLLGITKHLEDKSMAASLFADIETLEKTLTQQLFETVNYPDSTTDIENNHFIEEYTTDFNKDSFSKIFQGYYDNRNPAILSKEDLSISPNQSEQLEFDHLFSQKTNDLIYTTFSLENDINTIKQIAEGNTDIKTFDYDGVKYVTASADELIPKLETQLIDIQSDIDKNDLKIHQYFVQRATVLGRTKEFESTYTDYSEYNKLYTAKYESYNSIVSAVDFISKTTPFETIENNLLLLKEIEIDFKKNIQEILILNEFESELNPEIKNNFELYLSKDWVYFNSSKYNDDALDALYAAINSLRFILNRAFFKYKKNMLDLFEELR